MAIDSHQQRIVKCDLCGGDPACVAFCEAKALTFTDADTVHLAMKRACGGPIALAFKQSAPRIPKKAPEPATR